MKPYNNEYYKQQLDNFNNKIKTFKKTPEGVFRTISNEDNITIDTIKLKYKDEINGRIDGYLYKDFTTLNNFPILLENNNVWMSITPMEIDSHWMPIELAWGKVGVAGLGLGYFVQNILEKPEVLEVIVYEINQTIIDLYKQNFGEHEKLTIINKDIMELEDQYFDFFYNDIYRTVFCDDAIDHMKMLLEVNFIDTYFFWGMEGYLEAAIQESTQHALAIHSNILDKFIVFYQALLNSKFVDLYQSTYIDEKSIENFLRACSYN